jgi:hypothetical protein
MSVGGELTPGIPKERSGFDAEAQVFHNRPTWCRLPDGWRFHSSSGLPCKLDRPCRPLQERSGQSRPPRCPRDGDALGLESFGSATPACRGSFCLYVGGFPAAYLREGAGAETFDRLALSVVPVAQCIPVFGRKPIRPHGRRPGIETLPTPPPPDRTTDRRGQIICRGARRILRSCSK